MPHRQFQGFGFWDWLVIAVGVLYLVIIWWIDVWRERLGYRIEPAPYVGLGERSKIEQKAEGQQGGEPK
jgi:hypothetical protein